MNLKLDEHSKYRARNRYFDELNHLIKGNKIRNIDIQVLKKLTNTRILCKIKHKDIYLILSKTQKKVITFLTKCQSERVYGQNKEYVL